MVDSSRVGTVEGARSEAGPLAGLDPRWGITAVRLTMGVILIVAGLTKWLNGVGGMANFLGQIGIPVPGVLGPWVAIQELIGGMLVLLGIKVRWVALFFIVEFLVTAFYVKLARGQGWDASRIDLMMLAGAVMLLLAGAGKLSFDEWWARRGG